MTRVLSEIGDCVNAGSPVAPGDFALLLGVDVQTVESCARVGYPEHTLATAVQMLIRDFVASTRDLLDPADPDTDFRQLQVARPDLGKRLLMSLVGERTITRAACAASSRVAPAAA